MNPFKGISEPVPSNTIELTELEPSEGPPDWLKDDKVDVRKYIQFGLNQLDNRFYNRPDSLYACTLDNRYPGEILKTKELGSYAGVAKAPWSYDLSFIDGLSQIFKIFEKKYIT